MPRILVLTIDAQGGVAAARRAVTTELNARGIPFGVAHYATYPKAPELSVPVWRILYAAPDTRTERDGGIDIHRLGCRIPELEWRHYAPSRLWHQVISNYDAVICVSGSVLPAWPAVALGKPCLAWVGTPYDADREDRIRAFPLPRRIVDAALDRPVCRRLQRRLLSRAYVTATSRYAKDELESIVPGSVRGLIPLPVRDSFFLDPNFDAPRQGPFRIGFAGRYNDPRKNIQLLLGAIRICLNHGCEVTLKLVGDAPTQNLTSLADRLALSEHVQFLGPLDEEELRLFYRSIDLFAIPSHQEGFAIVGAEAMAAGCPVLSTRCGGPEEYVIHGVTGWLSNHTATDFAAKISSAVQMRYGLEHMRRTCHHLAASRYTTSAFAERLAHHMRAALRMSPIDQSARSKSDCSFYDDGGA